VLVIYLLSNFLSEYWLILNIVFVVVVFLVARYAIRKKESEFYVNKKVDAKMDRNVIVDVLVDSISQPTLLLSKSHKIMTYNQLFDDLIKDDIKEYVTNCEYIQNFLVNDRKQQRVERIINDKTFYIDMTKMSSEKIKGTIITYTDISSIKEMYARQEEFINEIKHELKTPVTAIVGLSDLLMKDKVEKLDDQKTILKTIKNETKRLDKLINKLSSSIDSQTQIEPVNMNDIFAELEVIYVDKSKEIPLSFNNYVDENFLSNKEIIQQIVINLVNNAIKFTKNGYIKVTAILENNNIKITVVDTGIGISEDDVERIFERFYRVDKSKTNSDGFGLGLSIVKALLESIDASIDVESALGKGTTVAVLIPYKK